MKSFPTTNETSDFKCRMCSQGNVDSQKGKFSFLHAKQDFLFCRKQCSPLNGQIEQF